MKREKEEAQESSDDSDNEPASSSKNQKDKKVDIALRVRCLQDDSGSCVLPAKETEALRARGWSRYYLLEAS